MSAIPARTPIDPERRFFAGWDAMLGIFRQRVKKCGVGLRCRSVCAAKNRTKSSHSRKSDRSAHGFALLVVLIVLLALSLIFGTLLRTSLESIDEASARVEQLKATAALDGALASAAYNLSHIRGPVQFGAAEPFQIGEYSVAVTIRPELSKLDINYATAEELKNLLEAADIPSGRATDVANSMVAWRDGPYGVPQAETSRSSPVRPFETVADLAHVSKAGADLVACLQPDVTVFTRTSSTDMSYASERLRRALLGSTDETERATSFDSVVGGAAARPELYEITEEIRDRDQRIVGRRQVVIRVIGDERRAVWILDQLSPGPSAENSTAACRRLASHV